MELRSKAVLSIFISLILSTLVKAQTAQPSEVSVHLSIPHPLFNVRPGEENQVKLAIKNGSNKRLPVTLEVSIESYNGTSTSTYKDLILAPQDSLFWTLPKSLFQGKGIKYLTYKLKEGNQVLFEGKKQFSYMTPGDTGEEGMNRFLFSTTGPLQEDQRDVLAAAHCGAKVVRVDARWNRKSKKPGEFDWSRLDSLVKWYSRYNIEIELILCYTPSWAIAEKYQDINMGKQQFKLPPDTTHWRNFVRDIGNRYNNSIKLWEVWNEPDIKFFRGTTEEYLDILRIAHEELKKINPENKIMTGFAHAYPKKISFGLGDSTPKVLREVEQRGDLQKKVLQHGSQYIDYHGIHMHGTFPDFFRDFPMLEKMRADLNDPAPLYFNETAMHNLYISDQELARIFFKKIIYSMSKGAIGFNWFRIRNHGGYPITHHERHYGMLKVTFEPKAVFCAFTEMTRLMKDQTYDSEIRISENYFSYLFRSKDDYLITLWKEAKSVADKVLVFEVGKPSKVEQIDLMGNHQEIPVEEGLVTVTINADCKYLRITGGRPVYKGALLEVPEELILTSGKKGIINPLIYNPFIEKKAVTLSFDNAKRTNKTLTKVLPGGMKESIMMTLPPSDNKNLLLKYSLKGTPWNGKIMVPVTYALRIPGKPSDTPQFILNKSDQVVDLYAHEPTNAHLLWQGLNDLSGKVWLSKNDSALSIKVLVNDDTHLQPHTSDKLYKGDGLQLGIQIPGQNSFWEFGFAQNEDGKPMTSIFRSPTGLEKNGVLHLKTNSTLNGLLYTIEIPLTTLRWNATSHNSLSFNILINDNDEGTRESWIVLTPGMGKTKNSDHFKRLIFNE